MGPFSTARVIIRFLWEVTGCALTNIGLLPNTFRSILQRPQFSGPLNSIQNTARSIQHIDQGSVRRTPILVTAFGF